jgi:hypothetical protein
MTHSAEKDTQTESMWRGICRMLGHRFTADHFMLDPFPEEFATCLSCGTYRPCGECGKPLTSERGWPGDAAYHRDCARLVYGGTRIIPPAVTGDQP